MKTIRNILIGASLSTVLFSTLSCSEERLELEPYNQVKNETVFTKPSLIEEAVKGMYNAAQIGDYAGVGRGYPFGAAYQQQNDLRGEDVVSTMAFYQFTYESTYNSAASLNNIYYWLDSYRLINRANLIISGIEEAVAKGVLSESDSNSFLGEALFFRAITHFELLKHFSRPYHMSGNEHYDYGVPYITKGSKDLSTVLANESMIDRETVSATYVKVLADLDRAEKLLNNKTTIYRASKEAAIAYKTIVKLHKRDWQGVIDEANKLDGLFSIEESPNTVFVNNASNKESIFSLENSATNNPGVNAALASMTIGRSTIAISPIIWNDPYWLSDDKRRYEMVELINGKAFPTKEAMVFTAGSGAKITNKYKDNATRTDASPIIRYAEVLLNRAEAKARLGDNTYISDLNAVRNRSLASPSLQAYKVSNFSTMKDAVVAILKEKRIEFIGEGKRWGDIHRLINDDFAPTSGIPAKYKNAAPSAKDYVIGVPYQIKSSDLQSISYGDYRFLWPIPERELNATPALKAQQNKGW